MNTTTNNLHCGPAYCRICGHWPARATEYGLMCSMCEFREYVERNPFTMTPKTEPQPIHRSRHRFTEREIVSWLRLFTPPSDLKPREHALFCDAIRILGKPKPPWYLGKAQRALAHDDWDAVVDNLIKHRAQWFKANWSTRKGKRQLRRLTRLWPIKRRQRWVYDPEASRPNFESLMSGPPFERNTERFPDSGMWSGQYQDLAVQLAWEAWCAAIK